MSADLYVSQIFKLRTQAERTNTFGACLEFTLKTFLDSCLNSKIPNNLIKKMAPCKVLLCPKLLHNLQQFNCYKGCGCISGATLPMSNASDSTTAALLRCKPRRTICNSIGSKPKLMLSKQAFGKLP